MSGVLCSFVGGTYASGFDTSTPIGTSIEGGFYGGLINDGGTVYALIVAPKSSGESSSKQWKTSTSATSNTFSTTNGPSNTSAMISAGASAHPAANFCNGLSIGGFTDWYMPAKDELEVLYFNLKPTTTSNLTISGANSNSVPPHGNYTAGNPPQTSASAFQSGQSEAFIDNLYWSSTAATDAPDSWWQWFSYGLQDFNNRTNTAYVRAVRRVAT